MTSDLIAQLDDARERWHTLRHPFYVRWERGELSREDIAVYAGQYRHAVVALADLAATAGDTEHAREERSHVALWDDFARACGSEAAEPTAETRALVDALAGAEPGAEADAVLYSLEASQPPVSRTKLEGLVSHYGFAADAPGTAYFRVHAVLDDEHAAQAAVRLRNANGDPTAALARAERALVANWELLDGVERLLEPQAAAMA
ncbi:MAG TPA: iron-containing redox enzyme family protein [Gaiellaceae bacterium]|nr:iron-containing redox enzyme family protein [Gaiellaceae bacterium]